MIEGDLEPWADSFPGRLVPDVLDLLLATWATLAPPAEDELETAITRRLRAALRRNQCARRLPFLVERETPVDNDAGMELGRLDLKFVHGHRDDVYLTFEAKRLHVLQRGGRIRRGASEYIAEGMMRFIVGRYASGLPEGGMLAYIMDGDCHGAARSLGASIVRRRSQLRIAPSTGWDKCDDRPGDSSVRQTRHELAGRAFRIIHVILPVVR